MPTFYIHVGSPKTGTTSLQYFLAENDDYLLQEHNLYVPKTARNNAKQALYPLYKGIVILDEIITELQLYKNSDFIISDESLYNPKHIQQDWIDKIQFTFPEHTIKIIYYIRRLDNFVRSSFNQLTKERSLHDELNNYSSFLNMRYTLKAPILFPSLTLETYAKLIGQENICVKIYDKTVLKNGNIIDDFCDVLGINIPIERSRNKKYNPSLDNRALPFLANSILPDSSNTGLCKKIVKAVNIAFSFKLGSGVGENILPEIEKEIDTIDSIYCPGYKKLFEENKCSFEFPELDVEPYKILTTSLIYQLIQENDEIKKEIKKEKELIGEVAQQVTGINQRTVSLEKTVNAIDQRTYVLEQKNNTINQRTYDIDQRTYVTEKKINEIDLRTYLLEQTINNISHQTNNLELILKDILFNTTEHFPNNKQKFFLFFYTPFIKLIAEKKYYNTFKENPAVFFANTQHPINKGFLKFLEIFGPKAIPNKND